MAMQDTKGGNNLAQSFLSNTATQAPAASMPQITRPQRFTAPQVQMPAPQAPQAPQTVTKDVWSYLGKEIPEARAKQLMYGIGSNAVRQRGQMPTMQRVTTTQAPVQQAPQPRQSQLMAEAINRRAMERGR